MHVGSRYLHIRSGRNVDGKREHRASSDDARCAALRNSKNRRRPRTACGCDGEAACASGRVGELERFAVELRHRASGSGVDLCDDVAERGRTDEVDREGCAVAACNVEVRSACFDRNSESAAQLAKQPILVCGSDCECLDDTRTAGVHRHAKRAAEVHTRNVEVHSGVEAAGHDRLCADLLDHEPAASAAHDHEIRGSVSKPQTSVCNRDGHHIHRCRYSADVLLLKAEVAREFLAREADGNRGSIHAEIWSGRKRERDSLAAD